MTGFKESFVKLSKHESPHNLDSGKSIKMKDVLFVPGLKKNLLSISTLDVKGMGPYICRWPSSHVAKGKDY